MAGMDDCLVLLGRRIRSLRKKHGMTQEGLASLAEVSGKYLSEVERGETNPTAGLLNKIAHGLGVELQELFDFGHEATRDQLELEMIQLIKDASEERLRIAYRVTKDILR